MKVNISKLTTVHRFSFTSLQEESIPVGYVLPATMGGRGVSGVGGVHPLPNCMLGYTPYPIVCWDTHLPAQLYAGIHPPMDRMNDTLLRKHYLPATTVAAVINNTYNTFGKVRLVFGTKLT